MWSAPTGSVPELPMYDWAFQGTADARFTDLDALLAYGERFDPAKLRGCIFHVSRCGSTAIANAFRSVHRTLVISESRALSAILLEPEYGGLRLPPETKQQLARGFIAAVLKEFPASGVVLKFPSFLSFSVSETLALIRAPAWCFSSRRPVEVIRSLERSPSGWLANDRGRATAMRVLRYTPDENLTGEAQLREIYVRLLERYFSSATAAAERGSVFLDYRDLRADTVTQTARFFLGDELDPEMRRRIADSLCYYSKAAEPRVFVPDESLADQPTGYAPLDRAYEQFLTDTRRLIPSLEPLSRS